MPTGGTSKTVWNPNTRQYETTKEGQKTDQDLLNKERLSNFRAPEKGGTATPTPASTPTPRPRKPGIYGYGDKDKGKTRYRRTTDEKTGKRSYFREDDDTDTAVDEDTFKNERGEFMQVAGPQASGAGVEDRERMNRQQRGALKSAYGRG